MKLQYSNPIPWIYVLFWLAAIAIFYCFPENDSVKYGLLLLAFITGLVVPQFYRENDIGESGVRFSLNTPGYSFVPLLVAFILCTTFMISDGIIGYLAVLYGVILMASTLVKLFFPTRRQPEYIEVREEGIYRPFRGAITMKFSNVKYAELTSEHLTFYEKWADHKIVFSEFKEGEKLKEVLMAKIGEVGIEVRRIS